MRNNVQFTLKLYKVQYVYSYKSGVTNVNASGPKHKTDRPIQDKVEWKTEGTKSKGSQVQIHTQTLWPNKTLESLIMTLIDM